MSDPQILSVATVVPGYEHSLQDVVEQAQVWVSHQEKPFRTKVERIFRRAGVNKRYTILPLDALFSPMTLAEKNDRYCTYIVDYAETALRDALAQAGLQPADLDCLIITSCTGHMSPSPDAFLINRLNLKPTIQRMPIMEMGCIGGVVGLMYAENYCRAYPGRYAAVIAAEFTSLTFQREDFTWANIVSTAIFGDGVACAILSSQGASTAPRIRASGMHHFPDTTSLLGFNLGNTGFSMILGADLPYVIREHFITIVAPLLASINWTWDSLEEVLIHPGGLKILNELESLLVVQGTSLTKTEIFQFAISREILRDYGNMSSATVLFLLQKMRSQSPANRRVLLAGFGPGLTAGTLLIE